MIPKGQVTAPPDEVPAYPYDLEQAKQLMAESSVPDGFYADASCIPAGRRSTQDTGDDPAGAVGRDRRQPDARGGRRRRALRPLPQHATTKSRSRLPQFTADVTVHDEVALLFFDTDPETRPGDSATGWESSAGARTTSRRRRHGRPTRRSGGDWPQAQQMAMDDAPWVTLFFLPSVHGGRATREGFRRCRTAGGISRTSGSTRSEYRQSTEGGAAADCRPSAASVYAASVMARVPR